METRDSLNFDLKLFANNALPAWPYYRISNLHTVQQHIDKLIRLATQIGSINARSSISARTIRKHENVWSTQFRHQFDHQHPPQTWHRHRIAKHQHCDTFDGPYWLSCLQMTQIATNIKRKNENVAFLNFGIKQVAKNPPPTPPSYNNWNLRASSQTINKFINVTVHIGCHKCQRVNLNNEQTQAWKRMIQSISASNWSPTPTTNMTKLWQSQFAHGPSKH